MCRHIYRVCEEETGTPLADCPYVVLSWAKVLEGNFAGEHISIHENPAFEAIERVAEGGGDVFPEDSMT